MPRLFRFAAPVLPGRRVVALIMVIVALGSVAVAAARPETPTIALTIRVWQRIEDGSLYLSTRPEGGRWTTHEQPLDMRGLSPSRRFRQSAFVDIAVPLSSLDGYYVEPTHISARGFPLLDECTRHVPQVEAGEYVRGDDGLTRWEGERVTGDGLARWRLGDANYVLTIPDGVTVWWRWRDDGILDWYEGVRQLHARGTAGGSGLVRLAFSDATRSEVERHVSGITFLAAEEDTLPSPHALAAQIVASVRSTPNWRDCQAGR